MLLKELAQGPIRCIELPQAKSLTLYNLIKIGFRLLVPHLSKTPPPVLILALRSSSMLTGWCEQHKSALTLQDTAQLYQDR